MTRVLRVCFHFKKGRNNSAANYFFFNIVYILQGLEVSVRIKKTKKKQKTNKKQKNTNFYFIPEKNPFLKNYTKLVWKENY